MRPAWAITVAGLGAVVGVGAAAVHAHRAHGRLAIERARWEQVSGQVAEILRASASRPVPQSTGGATESLPERVSEALRLAGLDQGALQTLAPGSAIDVAGVPGVQREPASLLLVGPTLPALGAFLARWRALAPDWTVTQIEVAPVEGDAGPAPGAERPLRVRIALERLLAKGNGSP